MKPPLFHPGQEVICTNDDFTLLLVQNPNIQTPKRGPIYTVRGVYDTHRGYGITLVEINNADVAPGFPEANFHESRFAPVPPLEEIDIAEAVEESMTVPQGLILTFITSLAVELVNAPLNLLRFSSIPFR